VSRRRTGAISRELDQRELLVFVLSLFCMPRLLQLPDNFARRGIQNAVLSHTGANAEYACAPFERTRKIVLFHLRRQRHGAVTLQLILLMGGMDLRSGFGRRRSQPMEARTPRMGERRSNRLPWHRRASPGSSDTSIPVGVVPTGRELPRG
jgi:hypothetical protein